MNNKMVYGRNAGTGQVLARVLDEQGVIVSELAAGDISCPDQEWHQCLLNISDVKGNVTICFSGRTAYHEIKIKLEVSWCWRIIFCEFYIIV